MWFRVCLLVVQWVTYAFLSRNLEQAWEYTGIQYSTPGLLSVLLAIAACVAVAAVLPSDTERPSDAALWLLASFVVTPTLAVSAVNHQFDWWIRGTASLSVVAGLGMVALLCRPQGRAFKVRGAGYLSHSMFVGVVVGVTLVCMAAIAFGYGLSSWDVSLGDEYTRRLASNELAVPFPGANYLRGWLLSPLIPLLTVMGLQWRKKWLLAIAAFGVILIWGFDGQKAAFVYPAIVVIIWLSMRRSGGRLPWLGGLLTFGLIVGPTVLGWLAPGSQLDYLVTRRFGLTPGILTHYYVQYTQWWGFTWFSQSWARLFKDVEDSTSVGIRVGEWLEPGNSLNANTNAFADGYASAGLLGVAITGLLLVLVLRSFDRVAASRDRIVSGVALGTVSIAYVNGYFHNSLLSGGVVLALALVWLMPDPRYGGRETKPVPGSGPRAIGQPLPVSSLKNDATQTGPGEADHS